MDNSITKTVKKRSRGAVKQGASNYHTSSLLSHPELINELNLSLQYFELRYSSLRDFLTIYWHYRDTETGIGPNKIIKSANTSKGAFRALYDRLEILKAKNLIRCSQHKYFPTDTAITELNNLLKSA